MTNEGNNQRKSDSNTEVRCWRSPKNCNAHFLQTQANLKLFAVKNKGENYKQEQTIILREFPKTLRNGTIHKTHR